MNAIPLHHAGESQSNAVRDDLVRVEPRSLRTFTPTQAVLSRSAGVFHWTADGRRLYDFTSGVLVTNLGHNPAHWMQRFKGYLGWSTPAAIAYRDTPAGFYSGLPLNAYNAVTPLEVEATARLV